jgi:hypothetical protein
MIRLSPDDASILAILAENPRTSFWKRLVDRISDAQVRDAARVIIDPARAADYPAEVVDLANDIRGWADRNQNLHATVGF